MILACSWHPKYFPTESPVIKVTGDKPLAAISYGICPACESKMTLCAWCYPGYPIPEGVDISHGICEAHQAEQMAQLESRRLEAARRAEGQHRCSRCDHYAAMDRPCPFSPLGREIAIDYGYAR